jgi:hypothetical protein
MSEATKQAADTTRKHLKQAETYLESAKKSAGQTGDSNLTKKVERILRDTTETRTDLDQKLGGPQKGG